MSLLAIADLGFCEGDGAMTWSGNYKNPIEVTPPGTDEAVRVEVRMQKIPFAPGSRCRLMKICWEAQRLMPCPAHAAQPILRGMFALKVARRPQSCKKDIASMSLTR